MKRRKLWISMRLALITSFALALGIGQGWAQNNEEKDLKLRGGKVTAAERKAAAERAKDLGLLPGVAGKAATAKPAGAAGVASKALPAGFTGLGPAAAPMASAPPLPGIEGPGGVPHYFGPYGNWAFSPLPKGTIASITVDVKGTGYTAPTVEILDAHGTGTGATATATVVAGEITAITVGNAGADYTAPIVAISDATGVDAAATAVLGNLTGGLLKFVDRLPGLGASNANGLGQYLPLGTADTTTYPGSDYYEIAVVEYTEQLHSNLPPTRLRGYVQLDTAVIPGAGIALFNPDGSPIMMPDGVTQARGVDKPHYLGPIIVAKGRAHGVAGPAGEPIPVRVKFLNLLPTGAAGNLFLPVDESNPGAGLGPALPGTAGTEYSQNRATIHLHGNNTVWISDGNVHQWISPAAENTPYPAGVSARNVPDMKVPGTENAVCDEDPVNKPLLPGKSGCMTFYYTNAQSARLQFYHDHAMGITRLNVYAGEAAGYVLTDAVEQDLIGGTNNSGVNPGLLKVLPPDNFGLGIPLVIQDRTFVDKDTVFAQDPTWNWGTGPRDAAGNITAAITGDFWYPHVYMTVQNPYDLSGTNAFGRWHYGPWFNPPVPECVNGQPVGCIEVGVVDNEYYDPINAPWEPPVRPGVPNPSLPGESFLDTPLVNGTAYPYMEVEPRAYRFRVLNAGNDRFVNLQLYVAADKTTSTTPDTYDPAVPRTNVCAGGVAVANCTEVNMAPVSISPLNQLADTPSGIPDPLFKGPDWIQIGTEGGFLPKPVIVPQQPIGYNLDMAFFAFGIINQHSLFLGSAERADVVVDFKGFEGKTLILYNDSPAPVPAGAAPYDYFTGSPSQVDAGGAPSTLPGYGPNTRTIMQIRVGTTVAPANATPDVSFANLETVFAKTATKRGVFELTQDPIIVPQAAYNSAYNASFPTSAADQYLRIGDTAKTFKPIDPATGQQLATPVTLPLQLKAMHDEMGGVYDTLFGRMTGMLGLSLQNSPNHVLVPYGLASPPTDLVMGSEENKPVAVLPDGTQIWRIFHNGVDTHPIHTHLFTAQIINRIDQSGQTVDAISADPNELGWKDTIRINPLEITYIAMRPTVPLPSQLPFEVPDSVRLIDPTLPEGATLIAPPPAGWFDPAGNNIPWILNHYVNFGWEYVWHCHILSHEEMDMMHSIAFVISPWAPSNLAYTLTGNTVNLSWVDNSKKELRFTVQRATNADFTTGLMTFNVVNPITTAPSTVNFSDASAVNNTRYWYRVFAIGRTVGDTQAYPAPSIGFPTMSANSVSGGLMVEVGTPPAAPTVPIAPTALTAAAPSGPSVTLSWTDNANNETGFVVERCAVVLPATTCGNFVQIGTRVPQTVSTPGPATYVDATPGANKYMYRVKAVNAAGSSGYATLAAPITVTALPVPTNFRVSVQRITGNQYRATLTWSFSGTATNFTIQRASEPTFTTGLATFTDNASPFTQNINRNTTYYYRIRANTAAGQSGWTNALPFPIRTGN